MSFIFRISIFCHLPVGVTSGTDCLRFQRFYFITGRHLAGHDPAQIILNGKFIDNRNSFRCCPKLQYTLVRRNSVSTLQAIYRNLPFFCLDPDVPTLKTAIIWHKCHFRPCFTFFYCLPIRNRKSRCWADCHRRMNGILISIRHKKNPDIRIRHYLRLFSLIFLLRLNFFLLLVKCFFFLAVSTDSAFEITC